MREISVNENSINKYGISRAIILIIYCVIVFVIALNVISTIMNHGNTDMTMDMSDASLPVVCYSYGSYDLTALHGYVSDMDVSAMRDNLTPLKEDRILSFKINTYGEVIGSIRYELRSMDGTRLIENGDISNYITEGNIISGSYSLKDLIQAGEEYSLCMILQTPEREAVRYYTRVFKEEDMDPYSMLAFAFNFSHKTFDKANAEKDIKMYLESNDQGDNSSFHKVDIHSSFYQITWGDLKVSRVTVPQASIVDLDKEVGIVRLDYMVMTNQEDKNIYYRVKEYFRMRKGEERMYLLSYDRTMNQIFDVESGTIANNKFVLGINDDEVEMQESADSNRIAFVNEGRLYGYNVTDNKLSVIYSFYSGDMLDLRTTYWKNDIHIFNVDESGNVEFMVYGYMNRGDHEGEMGISFYYYDSVLNTVEEQVYIPYNQSFEMLKHNVNVLSYMNSASKCYLFLDGALYEFNLKDNKYRTLIEGLEEDNFVYSEDHQMIAWVDDMNHAKTIEMYNLKTSRKILIGSDTNDFIKPIGFFDDDLVYGIAHSADITKDIHGGVLFPMYRIIICDENNRVLKQYEETGFYTVATNLTKGMLSLQRVKKAEGNSYVEAEDDQILNNVTSGTSKNHIETVIIDIYEKIVQVAVKSDINKQQMQILTPRFVLHEGGSNAELTYEDAREDDYMVFVRDELWMITKQPWKAVSLAYENNGVVLNNDGRVIYDKKVRPKKNQIMAISGKKVEENASKEDEKALCINTLLAYNGITEDVTELVKNNSAEMILKEKMPEAEILNLAGCNLDAALGYVAQDIPVLVEYADGSAVLLIGYNEYNTVIMDPVRGEVYKVGINDSTELFEENGNRFYTYIN